MRYSGIEVKCHFAGSNHPHNSALHIPVLEMPRYKTKESIVAPDTRHDADCCALRYAGRAFDSSLWLLYSFLASVWTGTQETAKARKHTEAKTPKQTKPLNYLAKTHFSLVKKEWW